MSLLCKSHDIILAIQSYYFSQYLLLFIIIRIITNICSQL